MDPAFDHQLETPDHFVDFIKLVQERS
jgi:hypothetical protein